MSINSRFPPEWLVTVTVHRTGGTDPKGIPLPSTEHTVADCLVSTQESEDVQRSDAPDTTCWLYAPEGSNFEATDVVEVPDGPLWPSGRFSLTGDPSPFPLGVRVPLKEDR